MLTVKQIAQKLNISADTIYNMVANREMPYYQITSGKKPRIRFKENEIEKWLEERHHREIIKPWKRHRALQSRIVLREAL